MIQEKYELLIIGAGICGLSLGNALTQSSVNFKIVEKSKAFGGRVATRRLKMQPVDHGAQYFTASDERFKLWVRQLQDHNIVKQWTNRLNIWDGSSLTAEDDSKPRYVCPAGMTSIAKELAKVLPVSRELRITEAHRSRNLWHFITDSSVEIQAERVVSTAPLPQSLEIFGEYLTSEHLKELERISYKPCLCAIFTYEASLQADWKGIFWRSGKVISWVANDSSKRENPSQTILVVHCQPQFSSDNFEEPEEKVLAQVLAELKSLLPDWVLKPQESHLKKWRYSQVAQSLESPFLQSFDQTLVLTGDWCLGSKVESSYVAGLEVAKILT